MAELGKILAQQIINDPPTGSQEIYLAPTGQLTKVESIFVCNTSGSARTFNISVDKTGDNPGVPQDKDYLYYQHTLGINETLAITTVIRLEGGDRMEAVADDVGVTFNVYGTEY